MKLDDMHWIAKLGIPRTEEGYRILLAKLKERGIDPRRIIVDEAAPLFHMGTQDHYPRMRFIYSDNDMKNRPEQTRLVAGTMNHFGYDNFDCVEMHGTHCAYVGARDENGVSVFGPMIVDFINTL